MAPHGLIRSRFPSTVLSNMGWWNEGGIMIAVRAKGSCCGVLLNRTETRLKISFMSYDSPRLQVKCEYPGIHVRYEAHIGLLWHIYYMTCFDSVQCTISDNPGILHDFYYVARGKDSCWRSLWRAVSRGRDPMLEQGKSVRSPPPEKEGAAETMCDELTETPIPRPPVLLGGRR